MPSIIIIIMVTSIIGACSGVPSSNFHCAICFGIYLGVNTMIHPVLGILARTMQWWNEKEIRRTVDSKSSALKSKSWIASMLL